MKELYARLFTYVPERKKYAYIAMVLSALSVFIYMFAYWYLWKTIKLILVDFQLDVALNYSLKIVFLMILRGVVAIIGLLSSHFMGFRLETNLRKKGLYNLLDASFSFYDKNNSGKIRKIIDDNAGNTHSTVAHLIPNNVIAVLTPIAMLTLTFMVDIRLGILLILVCLVGVVQYRLMYNAPELMDKFSKALENMSAATVEYIRGMQVIKIFGVGVKYYKTLIESIIDYKDNVYAYSQACKKPYVAFQVLFNSFYAFMVPLLAYFIIRGDDANLLLAKLVFFTMFSGVILSSFMSIMFTGTDNYSAKLTLDKLEGLIENMEREKIEFGTDEKIDRFDIEFSNVSFKYEDNFILKDFNLKLYENKTYALVGSSGSGKSTIAKLISGFYPIDKGKIIIGGKNISSYSEKTIQENIAYIFQHAKLFKKSIFENVLVGNPKASREMVLNALHLASCDSILDKFENRENTIIGSKGVYLSGGEIQRIAIARAILKDANIIIMDEASAATDPENEYELQRAFSSLIKNKTVIMIAHRLSSITNVDEILFIDDGSVIERGSHKDLIAAKGRYKKLYDMYNTANEWRI
ncbi:MAG: ABC transporter ATP-binding protein [Clostridioides difficile]|nr:ABC transporter ATP-binding protein [Clostridioides difficile]